MMIRRLLIVAVLLMPRNAFADDPEPVPPPTDFLHLKHVGGFLHVPGHDDKPPVVIVLPKDTRVLMPHTWDKLDGELRTLQDSETRLTAENKYMRERVKGWQPGWKTLGIATLTGIATGIYLGHKL